MFDIRVCDALWRLYLLPEGQLDSWRVADGAEVANGEALAELRIADTVHTILAPAAGRLQQIATTSDVIEPGSLLGRIT